MGDNMLKWLVIHILNKLASYLIEGELCFKVIERICNMATNENSGLWFDCHTKKMYAKVYEIELLNWAKSGEVIMKYFAFLQTIIF